MSYYLRMEGVNLYSFLEDTLDLSTVRGGGLLLLHATERVMKNFALTPISTGASEGIFAANLNTVEAAHELRCKVAEFLASNEELKHATFVVDVHPAGDEANFPEDKEAIIAQNRWRQFQQPTVLLPPYNTQAIHRVCKFDGIRPGTELVTHKKQPNQPASSSVKTRREYGIKQKQAFYIDEIKRLRESKSDPELESLITEIERFDFAYELETLTDDPSQENLHHKMAVIYLDGNGFGKIQREALEKAIAERRNPVDVQRNYDKNMKKNRAEALRCLLARMVSDEHFQSRGNLLIETLLWGGDELTWVVPAWKGWEVLQLFYQVSKNWAFEGSPLTHAGGIVFCHHNAPIHRIVHLAKELSDAAKKDAKRTTVYQDLFQYVILESFDHIGQDLESFRRKQHPCPEALEKLPWKLSLRGGDMERIAFGIRWLKDEFPRNKVFAGIRAALQQVRKLTTGSDLDEEGVLTAYEKRLQQLLSPELVEKLSDELATCLCKGGTAMAPEESPNPGEESTDATKTPSPEAEAAAARLGMWLHVADLWDYIPG